MQKIAVPILMYHSIANDPKGSPLRGLSVPPLLFRIQMYFLKFLGYKGLSMENLVPYLKEEKTGKVFGITFDDGYLNNYTHALPILKKLNFSATCFIVSENIGGINHWDIDKGVLKKKMMNIDEITKWIKSGMEIGSHSSTHIRLSDCSNEQLSHEILNSKNKLEELFKVKVNHFCYPFGDYSTKVIDFLKSSEFISATTVERGRAKTNSNLFELPRVLVNHRTYPIRLLIKISSDYEDKRSSKKDKTCNSDKKL